MGEVKTFRDLIAWQRSMALTRSVYQWTETMPGSERFGLTNQMRRAAVSVPSNIAEGYARGTRGDYLKHLRMGRGSLAELTTQIHLAIELRMLEPDPRVHNLLNESDRVLQGLIRSIEHKRD